MYLIIQYSLYYTSHKSYKVVFIWTNDNISIKLQIDVIE